MLAARENVPLFERPPGSILPTAADWANPRRRCELLTDPRSGEPWARLPLGDAQDVDRAVTVARGALITDWTARARAARIAFLDRLIGVIEENRVQFVHCICSELGCDKGFADDKHVGTAVAHLRATLAAASSYSDDLAPDPAAPEHRVRHEPLGVAALITPWNWPLNQLVLKVGAALVAGCSVVLKPSELATPTALLLARCTAEAGLPKGAFTLVVGDGDVGAALAAHPGVDVISFTGSTAVGRQVARAGAERLVRTNLELGGKSPNLLFADCALPLAVEQGVAHAFRNAGQSCNAASRMLVEAQIYDRVVELAAKVAEASTPMPLVSTKQFDRVQKHIVQAVQDGARLVAGGPGFAPNGAGFAARPTVFADVRPQMRLAQTEVFGPVLAISRFEDEADAISQANATEYGLAAYIQTRDAARADRVARQLNVGMVQVNGSSRAAGAPFGGRKASGWGREAGLWGIRAFQDIKSVSGVAPVAPPVSVVGPEGLEPPTKAL